MPARSAAPDPSSAASAGHSSSETGRGTGGRPVPTTPGLHLVATPIGNLRDISLRALDTLRDAEVIACEDTRVTRKLLSAHDISTPLTAYHDHNAARAAPGLLARLEAGAIVALVSDAGMPLISDPGYRLVGAALARGIAVSVVPGPSAPLAALVLAGLPTDRFHFAGYLPARRPARRRALFAIADIDATLILLETTPRLAASLADMAEVLGARAAAVARELTKRHEEILRGPLDILAQRAAAAALRGETVVVVAPPDAPAEAARSLIDAELDRALATLSLRDAATAVAAALGAPRRMVYERALAMIRRRRE